jgi:hypothetical protein
MHAQPRLSAEVRKRTKEPAQAHSEDTSDHELSTLQAGRNPGARNTAMGRLSLVYEQFRTDKR